MLVEGGGLSVDAAARLRLADGLAAVDGLAENVEKPAERALADRHAQALAIAHNVHAARKALTAGEHDAAHRLVAQMLRDLHHTAPAVKRNGERLADTRQRAARKAHIHHAAGHLNDLTRAHDAAPPFRNGSFCFSRRRRPR